MSTALPSLRVVSFSKDQNTQVIAGRGTFNLLAVEELFRAVATGAPSAKFGIAFAEGSDNRTLRQTGNDFDLIERASDILKEINSGHFFIILFEGAYPIQVLNNVKMLATTVNVQVASGNAISAVVADFAGLSAVLGFTDGLGPSIVENSWARADRRSMVRKIGYLEADK